MNKKTNLPEADIHKKCKLCTKPCKQHKSVVLVNCPNYEMQPIQLEITFSYPKRRKQ